MTYVKYEVIIEPLYFQEPLPKLVSLNLFFTGLMFLNSFPDLCRINFTKPFNMWAELQETLKPT